MPTGDVHNVDVHELVAFRLYKMSLESSFTAVFKVNNAVNNSYFYIIKKISKLIFMIKPNLHVALFELYIWIVTMIFPAFKRSYCKCKLRRR